MGGALNSQAEGGFLMVEYHKSSAAFSLTAQLIVRVKLVRAITAVRSLGEDGLGGQRFLVLQHEAPAQSILTQRAQQKTSKRKFTPTQTQHQFASIQPNRCCWHSKVNQPP